MLAVHWQQCGARRTRRVGHQSPGGDQRLLIGQSDRLARFDRGHHWPEAGTADDRRDHQLRIAGGGFNERILAGRGPATRADEQFLKAAYRLSSATTASRAPVRRTMSASASMLVAAVTATTLNRSRWRGPDRVWTCRSSQSLRGLRSCASRQSH